MSEQSSVKPMTNPYKAELSRLRRAFMTVGLFSAAINILMLTGPLYMLQVYDRVLSSGSVATLQGLFIIVVVLYAFLGVYEFLRARLLSRASYRMDQAIGSDAFGFWMRSGFEDNKEHFNPVQDMSIIRAFLASPAILGLFDLPWIPIFLAVVFFIHPWLGWLTIGGAAIVIIAAIINRFAARDPIKNAAIKEGVERSFVERARRNAEAIMALGMVDKVTARWNNLHDQSLGHSQSGGDRTEIVAAFSKSFRLLLQSTLLTVGAYLALRQEISPGMIIATSIVAGRALAPVDQVIGHWRTIGRAGDAHRRLKEAMDRVPDAEGSFDLPEPKGHLVVKNVSKLTARDSLVSDRPRILERINFELEPGDGLGVVGSSAAGKSSLARLLVGLWKPDHGEIRLDGATLNQWNAEELGRHIGYLPQRVEMLPGTIAENIARFDPDARDDDVIDAAKIAGVHQMILKMPQGYATFVGTTDQPLSGGQTQRLGLARAVYGNPRLLVLDEPNSNLDAKGDEALANAIMGMRNKKCTVLVMAHRPSVIQAVNKILILHEGKVGRFGLKEDVMQHANHAQAAAPATTAPSSVFEV